ncbi:hypothetical protein [Cryptosporangium sp. NPDC048952]|uniref:hypothetical protein n=1 Tax=Cryptosporangium sp. NPDC048952 TaxID=3363961 RepID=UPI00371351C0
MLLTGAFLGMATGGMLRLLSELTGDELADMPGWPWIVAAPLLFGGVLFIGACLSLIAAQLSFIRTRSIDHAAERTPRDPPTS